MAQYQKITKKKNRNMLLSEREAKHFIDIRVLRNSHRPDYIIVKLENKIEEWKAEKFILGMTNIFDMSQDETIKHRELTWLIEHGESVVNRHQISKWKLKRHTVKAKVCGFCGK